MCIRDRLQVVVPPPAPPVGLAVRVIGVEFASRQIGAIGVILTVTVGQACAVQVWLAVVLGQLLLLMAVTSIVTEVPGVRPVSVIVVVV